MAGRSVIGMKPKNPAQKLQQSHLPSINCTSDSGQAAALCWPRMCRADQAASESWLLVNVTHWRNIQMTDRPRLLICQPSWNGRSAEGCQSLPANQVGTTGALRAASRCMPTKLERQERWGLPVAACRPSWNGRSAEGRQSLPANQVGTAGALRAASRYLPTKLERQERWGPPVATCQSSWNGRSAEGRQSLPANQVPPSPSSFRCSFAFRYISVRFSSVV